VRQPPHCFLTPSRTVRDLIVSLVQEIPTVKFRGADREVRATGLMDYPPEGIPMGLMVALSRGAGGGFRVRLEGLLRGAAR
jgi:hypothetical protein